MKRVKQQQVRLHICTDCSRQLTLKDQRLRMLSPVERKRCGRCRLTCTGRALVKTMEVEV